MGLAVIYDEMAVTRWGNYFKIAWIILRPYYSEGFLRA